ncbi:phosphate signaling complex protein PhoU [Fredinandcohnia sp. QZ13]|uniref:phosphate signaling complex protein PhoU n=1 Tax=Fredinandcohnia sp. QZ13 TaxID=3073144 RepID=UPI0028537325|nr:phosphate signaling complex protein PhoU [Fredinandcohnia sp. QZ13]MDR4889756.1 phosphate signaling complex protein PhoU [Fredinandcohnia sp. QZ13]
MTVRATFQAELNELKEMIIQLGNQAQEAVGQAIDALKNQDVDKALKIIENDNQLNIMEEEINDKAILLIAQQAPVAIDLRRVIVAIKISSDLERIGDLAVNIAKSVIRIGTQQLIKPIEDIPRMAEVANKMVADSLRAYNEEDVVLAKNVAKVDDEVDEAYGKLIKELLELMTQKPENISQITQLSFICRNIERVADHSTNISESILYLIKGKRYDLNQ